MSTHKEAPPLPEKVVIDTHIPTGIRIYGHTADQLHTYAEQYAAWKIAALRSEQAPAGEVPSEETQAWEHFKVFYGENAQRHGNDDWRGYRRGWQARAALSTPPAVPPELTPMLLMNAAFCCEPGSDVPDEKRQAIATKLLSVSKALSAAPAAPQTKEQPTTFTVHASVEKPVIDALVDRFLAWPVPASVHPDGIPGQIGRTGTNLLSAAEAKEMLSYCLAAFPITLEAASAGKERP